MLTSQAIISYAVEVNNEPVVVGDIVTYEVHAVSCPKNILGLDVSIFYDAAALQYIDNSLELPELPTAIVNSELNGEIRFNAVDMSGFEFQADKIVATLEFVVISDYNPYPKLDYEVNDFIDVDRANHGGAYAYGLTYINDKKPADSTSKESSENSSDTLSSTNVSSASSSAASKTPSRTSEASSKNTSASEAVSKISDSDNSLGNISSFGTSSKYVEEKDTQDIPKQESETKEENGFPKIGIYLFIIALAAVIVLAIVFIILKNKSDGSHMD